MTTAQEPVRPEEQSPLEAASHEPLYGQLANRLAADISSGRLAPGQQVPTEAELMSKYRISRVTVRQAMQLLTRNGQVISRRGKGSFVARTSLQQDLSSLQGFREALRKQGIEPQTELLEFSPSGGRVETLPLGLDLPVRLRRRYLVEGEAFAIVEAFLPAAAAPLGEARAEHLTVYDILQQSLGLHIGRAEIAIQCARPTAKVARELGLEPRGHVLLMQRTSYTVVGEACEHMRIHIVPERYTFRMSVPGPLEIASAVRPSAAEPSRSSEAKPALRSKARAAR